MLKDNLNKLIDMELENTIRVRRMVHSNPELGMNEYNTSEIVLNNLQGLGLEIEKNISKTGVVALLRGDEPGKTLMIRADMDALPIQECTDLSFKSKNQGIMHACGHDVHTSILLGVAKVLSKLRKYIKGNVKFVFQPAEECNPTGGARYMVEEGILDNPKVDAAIALHVWDLPVGKIGTRYGPIMAQSDRIFIKIKGRSSHASAPHQGIDAIVGASHVVTALQTIVSRNINPLDSAVISIGLIKGGYRYNVIADTVDLEGTVRTFDKEIGEMMPKTIENIVKNTCEALRCSYEFKYVPGYSLTYNDKELTHMVIQSLNNFIGDENIIIGEKPATGSEDFSFFNKYVPCTFMWLGCKSEINKNCCTVHSPNFICDESSIPIGMKALAGIALDYLK